MNNKARIWTTRDFWLDALERIVTTFLFAYIAAVTATGFDWTNWKAWAGAAVAAGFSTAKSLVGAMREKSTTPVSIL